MRSFTSRAVVVLSLSFPAVSGCSGEAKPDAVPSAAPMPTPAPAPAPAPEPPKAEEKPSRPEKIDTEVTAERRAKLEAATPDAKGFLVGAALEDKLKANKTLKDKEAAVKAFDRLALGKWILFTGPISNPAAGGFELGVTYTPQIKGDVMGMSRQWFPVAFTDVKGYDSNAFKPGQMVVVLAKYTGKEKAGPGEEAVAVNQW